MIKTLTTAATLITLFITLSFTSHSANASKIRVSKGLWMLTDGDALRIIEDGKIIISKMENEGKIGKDKTSTSLHQMVIFEGTMYSCTIIFNTRYMGLNRDVLPTHEPMFSYDTLKDSPRCNELRHIFK